MQANSDLMEYLEWLLYYAPCSLVQEALSIDFLKLVDKKNPLSD